MVVGLLAVLALAAPAAALPALALTATPARAPRLQDALLTVADLPRGYSATTGGMTSAVGGIGSDTSICDHKVSTRSSETAQAAFIGGLPGPMLVESLAATGPRTARAIVAAVATAPRRCTSFHGKGMNLEIVPMRAPRLGDASAAVRFVLRPAATTMVIQGRLVSVARGGVAVTLVQINAPRQDQRELTMIAANAVRKLDRLR